MKEDRAVIRHSSPVTRHAAPVALAAAMLLAGCDYIGYTSIKDIQNAPVKYEGTEVKIKGTVSSPVALLSARSFMVKDDTGEIQVTTTRSLPASGDQVAVKGTVKSAMLVSGKALGLRVEETQRLR